MTINVNGKEITITEKNARAYQKLNFMPVDALAIECYVSSYYKTKGTDTDKIIMQTNEDKISELINKSIEMEVRDCGGDAFYEEA